MLPDAMGRETIFQSPLHRELERSVRLRHMQSECALARGTKLVENGDGSGKVNVLKAQVTDLNDLLALRDKAIGDLSARLEQRCWN